MPLCDLVPSKPLYSLVCQERTVVGTEDVEEVSPTEVFGSWMGTANLCSAGWELGDGS